MAAPTWFLDPSPLRRADEQLDAWLARLPASRSSDPELDVHPQTLVIRAATAGGLICKSLRITNVGYRLLRSTVRVEPAASMSIRVAAEFSARPFLTIDYTDTPVEIELPENARSTTLGTVVVDSNGGVRRIEILLERPALNTATAEGVNGSGPVDLVIDTRPLGELDCGPAGRPPLDSRATGPCGVSPAGAGCGPDSAGTVRSQPASSPGWARSRFCSPPRALSSASCGAARPAIAQPAGSPEP